MAPCHRQRKTIIETKISVATVGYIPTKAKMGLFSHV